MTTILICVVWAVCLGTTLFLSTAFEFEGVTKDDTYMFTQPKAMEEQEYQQTFPFIIITFIWAVWSQSLILALSKFLMIYEISLNHF